MNELTIPKRGHHFEKSLILDALVALRERAAIEAEFVELEPDSPDADSADASIDIGCENECFRYLVVCKLLVDRKAQIDQVRRQLESSIGSRGLLVAPCITRELAAHCRATGLQFIDACGNAYLRAPGLLVLITGEKGERGQPLRPPKGLTSPAVLRVVFALLSKPELVNAPLKDIANHALVSLGTAYNALEDLDRRGYLVKRGTSARRTLLERHRLMEEWVINYPTTLRTKLHARRFSAVDPLWWKNIDASELQFAWGSEVAAEKMTGYLKPATQTLYVRPTEMQNVIGELAKRHRIRLDPDGEIEILEKFWNWESDTVPELAPPLLVYTELRAILDGRTNETADIIKEKFIDPAFDKD
ncbi:MAG: type IV toxin-antitoxin system AbiEi family antitoxin [Pseudomonadota bacterium]